MASGTISDILGGFGGGAASTGIVIGLIIIGIVIACIIAFAIIFFIYQKKKWNLKVEIKLIRSDGRVVIGEWGKGAYDARKGVCFIKRGGMTARKIPLKIFDIKKYLQGSDLLTVVQVGPEDYRPVIPESFTYYNEEYVDDETKKTKVERALVANLKIDDGADKAWKSAWDAAAKKAYSLTSFFQQFQTPIAIGIVILCCFVGFAILWSKIGAQ